eukprot:CAMPEP_0175061770 /NCGR_PEP_ID=MMETSP0052_2-20121109/13776_1 /TAXON_ID=51329 ORGANISM="Polytomella parva, Strain SAG 63-3" /NCGR_SAMPLE_ID=MMETSP0052_2 /ASSEMBLY_ACC=CAM_ASM_000194 /LENGTH=106 /DNA_ID=CAMNT_0016327675 /DNA_START=120 /DNA_END=440 /DNA_ORIENTATION=+
MDNFVFAMTSANSSNSILNSEKCVGPSNILFAKNLKREDYPFSEQVSNRNFDDKDYIDIKSLNKEKLLKKLEDTSVDAKDAKWDDEKPFVPLPRRREYRNKDHPIY